MHPAWLLLPVLPATGSSALVSTSRMPHSRFEPVVRSLKGLVPDGFIYLHATPETCMRRMASRCAPCLAFCQMGCSKLICEIWA